MKKLLLATALLIAISAPVSAAQHKDVLLAVMDNGEGEKTIHQQMVQHESCMTLITNLKRLQKQDQKNATDVH